MSLSNDLRRMLGRGGLPLLVSLLIHLALLGFSYPGKAAGGGPAGNDGPPSLRASLSRSVAAAPLVSAPLRQQRSPVRELVPEPSPALDPAPGGAEPLADDVLGTKFSADQRSPVFYASQALTVRPVALSEPVLDEGGAASGEIVLALWIDDQGTVVDLSVERSELPADRLPALAEAFRSVRFAPGELNGQKVGAVMRVAVSYDDERLPIAP